MISIFPEWWTLLQDLIQLCQHFLQCLSPNTSECKSTFGVATDLGRKSREWVFWSCSQDWKSKQSILPWTAPERPAGLLTARGRIVLVAKAGHKEQVRPHRAQSGTAQALVCWKRGAECLKGSYFFLLKKKQQSKYLLQSLMWPWGKVFNSPPKLPMFESLKQGASSLRQVNSLWDVGVILMKFRRLRSVFLCLFSFHYFPYFLEEERTKEINSSIFWHFWKQQTWALPERVCAL